MASKNIETGLYHLTGLVHVSEVSWDLVQDARDVLSEGDKVRVKIISINRWVFFWFLHDFSVFILFRGLLVWLLRQLKIGIILSKILNMETYIYTGDWKMWCVYFVLLFQFMDTDTAFVSTRSCLVFLLCIPHSSILELYLYHKLSGTQYFSSFLYYTTNVSL